VSAEVHLHLGREPLQEEVLLTPEVAVGRQFPDERRLGEVHLLADQQLGLVRDVRVQQTHRGWIAA